MTTTQQGRRDHFVPQGYLRGFAHPDRAGESRSLWVFSVVSKAWEMRDTHDFAWVRGFYDYSPGSIPDGVAENVFRKLENDLPRVREKIRSEGYATWTKYAETLVHFAAMLSARSPMFIAQASSTIGSVLSRSGRGALVRNYAITTMRGEIPARCKKWMSLNWVLRYTSNPSSPVICSDQTVGMTSDIEEERLALEDPLEHPSTILFFPVAFDMCLFGSPAPLGNPCDVFLEPDLARLRGYVVQQARSFVVSPVKLVRLDDHA